MRRQTTKLVGSILFLACMAGAIPAHADATKDAIEAANKKFEAAAAAGDGAALAALYTADGQVMPAGSEPVKGTEAIKGFWASVLQSGVASVSLKTKEVFGQGTHATEVGEYDLKDKAGKTLDHGKYIVIWKHEGADWKLVRDMFSTNAAPKK